MLRATLADANRAPMATPSLASQPPLVHSDARPQLSHKPGRATLVLFFGLLLAGIAYTAWSLKQDVAASGTAITTATPFLLLGLALLIALGFEFVNGFHDTANAVATVIYTHSLPAPVAVVWSGLCNFLGVLLSSGAVAFGIIALLPAELILQVGSSAGFAMVLPCCWQRSSGTLAPGGWGCRRPLRTR